MLFWIIIAVLTAAALAAVLAPLRRPAAHADPETRAGLGVYRQQLKEIDDDLERGLIGAEEASAARIEVSRRLLREGSASATVDAGPDRAGARRAILAAVTVVVPVLSVAVYLAYGSPGQPSLPHGANLDRPLQRQQVEVLVARVEEQLRSNPEDGRGWDVIAPVYMRLGRLEDAVTAYGHAIRLVGETPDRLRGLAEASIAANDGLIKDTALRALERLRALDPADPVAGYGLALAKEQDGKRAEALADLRNLLAAAPAGASWRSAIEQRIAMLSSETPPQPTERGPTADDMAAAQSLSPAERQRMIEGMVEGLAQRLKENGEDAGGWMRLLRAYAVLGKKTEAEQALVSARSALKSSPKALEELETLARALGLGS